MKKIESFKSFSQLQAQLKEDARQNELATKREGTVTEFNKLLQKYNVANINDLNEEDVDTFFTELLGEGNAFGAARAEAIAKGEKEFEVDGETFKVEDVDAEDKENAEEFANEGNAFGAARAEAIAKGEKTFKVDGEEFDVESVDKEDKENAEEFANEAEAVTERLSSSEMKRISSLINNTELNNFKMAFVAIAQDLYNDGFEFDDVISFLDAVMREPNVRASIEEAVQEGRAFVAAAKKAKDEGLEEFEFEGKKYPVLIKEGEVNEAANRTAMEIGGLTGLNKDAVQKFVDSNELDIEKVFQFVKKGKLKDRMDLVSVIAGKPNNPIQKKMITMFKESVNEGKRENGKVLTVWKKSNVKDLNSIARVYADAMTDANFHWEAESSKGIGAASKGKSSDAYSDIAHAAGWSGYAIANGTLAYLRELGEEAAANKFEKAIAKFELNESVSLDAFEQIIEEGTRGQFGKIDKNGNIQSVYTHYDSYPEHMLRMIKRNYKNGQGVDDVIKKGDNSGLMLNPDEINFYNDGEKPTTGNVKKVIDYLELVKRNAGAEFVYLWDEKTKQWFMADIYDALELKPAF